MISDGERLGRWTSGRLPVEATDAWCEAAMTADLIWVESPSNPLLQVADLQRIGSARRSARSIWRSTTRWRVRSLNSRWMSVSTSPCSQRPSTWVGTRICCAVLRRRGAGARPTAPHTSRASRRDARHARDLPRHAWRSAPIPCAPRPLQHRHRNSQSGWRGTSSSSVCDTPVSHRTRVTRPPSATWRTSAVSSPSTWREGVERRRRLRTGGDHPPCDELRSRRIDDRASGRRPGPGTPAAWPSSTQRRHRARRGSLGRPQSRQSATASSRRSRVG